MTTAAKRAWRFFLKAVKRDHKVHRAHMKALLAFRRLPPTPTRSAAIESLQKRYAAWRQCARARRAA